MNNNIDFSDFNKITVGHNSRCRKFTKHKFTILFFLFIIILIILIIVFINKNNQIEEKNKKLSEIKNKIILDNSKLENVQQNLTNSSYNLSYLNNIEDLLSQYIILKDKYDLVKKIDEQKALKVTITERLNNKDIKTSNIQKNVDKFQIITSTQVKQKCYDSIVYGYNPTIFHKNCDGNSLLFLIKTEDQKLGAYTSTACKEKKNIQEKDSLLINFDSDKYYKYTSNNEEKCKTFYGNFNFPQFGEDLILSIDGYGNSKFPFCYGINEGNEGDFSNYEQFSMNILEIYKVETN